MTPLYSLEVRGNVVAYRPAERIRNALLVDELTVEYPASIDLTACPPSVLAVPAVANFAPIVWLSGERLTVPVLDARFAESLERTRRTLAARYAQLSWTGEIAADEVENVDGAGEDGRFLGVLFSGGLDSTYTSLALPGPQLLITAWGNDVSFENEAGWQTLYGDVESFAEDHAHDSTWFRSNFRRLANERLLGARTGLHWWGEIQHGLGLVGMTAPIVFAREVGRIAVAGSTQPDFAEPWGSDPGLLDPFGWDAIRIDVHGTDLSRQAKAAYLASRCTDSGVRPVLHVCWEQPEAAGANCGRCQKCLRTAIALALEDENYAQYGFPVATDAAAATIRAELNSHTLRMGPIDVYLWDEIRRRTVELLETDDPAARSRAEPFRWLVELDLPAYRKRYRRRARLKRPILRLLRPFPRLEAWARSAVRRGRRLRERI